jgi:hypothetical protein
MHFLPLNGCKLLSTIHNQSVLVILALFYLNGTILDEMVQYYKIMIKKFHSVRTNGMVEGQKSKLNHAGSNP